MSDTSGTTSTTGSVGAAGIQQVYAGAGKKYPRIATGKNGERHVIRSKEEEPHPEDERPKSPVRYKIFRDRRRG